MKKFDDITVVVQGPVQTFHDRPQEPNITQKCLASVRQFLPGAKIILSTWAGQDLSDLDYDELVISDDPGPNCRNYRLNGEPQWYNNNRQIVSSKAGLLKVNTPYAVKLRTDNYLISNAFVEFQTQFTRRSQNYAFLSERVVVSDTFTRRYAKGFPVAFHVSDFFYYGKTQDVLAFWDLPLFDNFIPDEKTPINHGFPGYIIDCTQAFFIKAMQKFDQTIELKSLLDNSPEILEQSRQCIMNNIIFDTPEKIGLGLCQKFLGSARVSRMSGKVAHIQFYEWLEWYKKYCDDSVDLSPYRHIKWKTKLFRFLHVYPKKIETILALRKRNIR